MQQGHLNMPRKAASLLHDLPCRNIRALSVWCQRVPSSTRDIPKGGTLRHSHVRVLSHSHRQASERAKYLQGVQLALLVQGHDTMQQAKMLIDETKSGEDALQNAQKVQILMKEYPQIEMKLNLADMRRTVDFVAREFRYRD